MRSTLPCRAAARAITLPPCRCGTPSAPRGWPNTAPCGHKNSLLLCPQNLHLVRLPQQGTALLEDLGNLAANELYRPDGSCLPPKQAAEKMLAGIEAIAAQCNHLIIVSNEVFSGGADYAGETDLYLQALAMVNNAVAAKADAVCRVVCGLPVYYKGGERP